VTRRLFSGREVVKALTSNNYRVVGREGSHVRLRWDPPDTHGTAPRLVSVPMHDEIQEGTLRNIADQCGADDFDAFCAWIDRNS